MTLGFLRVADFVTIGLLLDEHESTNNANPENKTREKVFLIVIAIYLMKF